MVPCFISLLIKVTLRAHCEGYRLFWCTTNRLLLILATHSVFTFMYPWVYMLYECSYVFFLTDLWMNFSASFWFSPPLLLRGNFDLDVVWKMFVQMSAFWERVCSSDKMGICLSRCRVNSIRKKTVTLPWLFSLSLNAGQRNYLSGHECNHKVSLTSIWHGNINPHENPWRG